MDPISWSLKKMKRKIKTYKNLRLRSSKKLFLLAGGISVLLIAILLINNPFPVFSVSINGRDMGYVKNKDIFYDIVDSVEKDLSFKYGTEVTIKEGVITFEEASSKEMKPLDESRAIVALSESRNSFLKAWGIMVNGRRIVALNSREKAQGLLEEIKAKYLREGGQYLEIGFKEEVEINEINVRSEEIFSYDEALRYILTGTAEKREHVVQEGESFWTIAGKYEIPIEELTAANPSINPDKIQIGQTINLMIPETYLTVVTLEKAVESEKIQYEIAYEKTEALFKGEENIKQKGNFGIKEISKQIIRENGQKVSEEVIDSTVIQAPKTQIVIIGTKALPASIGVGFFDNPTRGKVTSTFGRRWGKQHEGIDIASEKGTPIKAADKGTVTFAGWKGNYGLMVVIDHGDNKSTVYAHCATILVEVGDVVEKSQQIATMGDTGNATGFHLHFEILINDVPQDPMKYVNYTVN